VWEDEGKNNGRRGGELWVEQRRCIQNFPKAHDLKNVQKSTSISPYNKVIHKGPPQTGCENSQFCQNRGSNDKRKERFFNTEKKMGSEIAFFTFKIDPKRNLVPNLVHCPQSKAKQST
jgi:hypothetical protein